MADFPTLADVIENHPIVDGGNSCGCGHWRYWNNDDTTNGTWEQHVQVEWAEARTVVTVEQLDALPVRSVVRDADGDVHEMDDCGFWRAPRYPSILNAVVFPARLLWHPEAEA